MSSMVVFVEGRAKKSEYRKFKIQYDRGPNDFAMMQETLRRRLRYLRAETDDEVSPTQAQLAKKEKFNKKPDLLLIDGGKGQLSAVVEVLEEMDIDWFGCRGSRQGNTSGSTCRAAPSRSCSRRILPGFTSSCACVTKRTVSPLPIIANVAMRR